MGQRIDFTEKIGDMFARIQEKAAARDKSLSAIVEKPPESERSTTAVPYPHVRTLLPDRHPTRDFFIADILDWALKDDRHSMEHPMFSLSKKPDHRVRHYEHNGSSVTIKPGADGLATIWDKDVLI